MRSLFRKALNHLLKLGCPTSKWPGATCPTGLTSRGCTWWGSSKRDHVHAYRKALPYPATLHTRRDRCPPPHNVSWKAISPLAPCRQPYGTVPQKHFGLLAPQVLWAVPCCTAVSYPLGLGHVVKAGGGRGSTKTSAEARQELGGGGAHIIPPEASCRPLAGRGTVLFLTIGFKQLLQ